MQIRFFCVIAVSICCWLFAAPLVAQQTLSLANPSFESGVVGQLPTGWQVSPGSQLMYVSDGTGLSAIDPATGFDGSRFATATWQATGVGSSPFPAGQEMGIFQQFDLSSHASLIDAGGQGVDLSFVYNDVDPNDVGVVSLDFLDAQMNPLGNTFSFFTNDQAQNGSWSSALLSGETPVGARSAILSLGGRSIGGGTARNVSFDDFSAQLVNYVPPPPSDIVHGTLVQFNQNGTWSWYQDERAIVDRQRGELLVGSIASYGGVGGQSVDGSVQTSHFNFADRSRTIITHADIESDGGGDDHNVPAYLQKQDGDILTFYAAHNRRQEVSGLDDASYYRTFDASSGTWGPETIWHWWPEIPNNAPGSGGTTYSNVFQLASEDPNGDGHGRIYNIARTQQSPHFMFSDDNGATWEYGGQFTEAPAARPSGGNYVNGYYKYWSNGEDRIDFIATEYHPRDFNTSIYHGYIKDGKVYDSNDNVVDDDIFDASQSFSSRLVPSTDDFTPVFISDGVSNSRAWNTDVMRYPDGTIAALFKTRPVPFTEDEHINTGDHRVWYGRFDPTTQQWTTTEIAKAGARLFGAEEDYTGLGALDPDDDSTIYISTEINPITDEPTTHHEIYKGVTSDDGATWSWTALTENSTYDNLRPIVPQWDSENTALIWWRGEKFSHANNDAAVVGMILNDETLGEVTYVDASLANTTLSNGLPLSTTTGPDQGATDNLWHIRTGFANEGTVFTADESSSESVPRIKTSTEGLDEGVYDVFAYFWVDSENEWRIAAGLSESELPVFRIQGSQHAEADLFDSEVLTSEENRDLYQAFLGRVDLAQGESIEVLIDDYSTSGNGRVWYDGIGYALVTEFLSGDFNADGVVDGSDFLLWQRNPAVGNLADWQANYGAGTASTVVATVPEPTTVGLLAIGAICCGCTRQPQPARFRAK